MVTIAILALLLRVGAERLIKVTMSQNDSGALNTLKLIAAALENYARDHEGAFPTDISVLARTKPPYLQKDYLSASAFRGYIYSCLRLEPTGYSCQAAPFRCGLTGKMKYSVTTGGLLVSEDCRKNE
jgi:type II secretory pathway pseudopilin PulG